MPENAIAIPDPLTSFDLAKLAREIVMGIQEPGDILDTWGISGEQYASLLANPSYRQILDAVALEWNSATNTEKRIKAHAAALLEQALPTLAARMQHAREPLREVVESGKLFAKMAGVTGEGASDSKGANFVIKIDLGGDTQLRFEKTKAEKEMSTVQGIVVDNA